MTTKKVFLSYSTEFPAHQQWVIDLGNQLTTHGIDATIDVHELKLGQDMYVFMERIVSDEFDHVIILSDASYVRKANARTGGVGAEAQLLAPQIYKAVEQTRIIPVFTEFDEKGEPALPTFLQARFALDFSDPENYEQQYATLCLAILGESLHEKAPLGKVPNLKNLKEMAKRQQKTTPQNKNVNNGAIKNTDDVTIGDKGPNADKNTYANKNIQNGNVENVKKFRLGDGHE
ncbi:MAG: toll/interleukin-1 receptor domain-containing protein [Aureispira sp.]